MNDSPSQDPDTAAHDLPHGPEFHFVTGVDQLEPGCSARGWYDVRGDEAFLAGHFPGRPMMPGVLLIEALAQLAGIAAQSDPELGPLEDLRLTAVRQCKILGTARPGDRIQIMAAVSGRMGSLIQARGSAHVDTKEICRVDLVLSGS